MLQPQFKTIVLNSERNDGNNTSSTRQALNLEQKRCLLIEQKSTVIIITTFPAYGAVF